MDMYTRSSSLDAEMSPARAAEENQNIMNQESDKFY